MTARRPRGPMPTVTYDGNTYKLRSRQTTIPDLAAMRRIEALVWLNRNTTPRGYSKAPAQRLPTIQLVTA